MTVTQPLRDEHAELVPHIAALATAADAVEAAADVEALRAQVDASHHFLAHQLLPHAADEERVLYPAVQRAMGSPDGTATMSRDHVEVERLTEELAGLRRRMDGTASLDDDVVRALRRVLYGLHHVVKLHFAKEEEVFLPILDRHLDAEEAEELFAAMHHGSAEHSHAH